MPKPILLLVVYLSLFGSLTAQNINQDSLLAIIKRPKDDTGKVLAYHILSSVIVNTDATAAIAFGKKGLQLSQQLNYLKGEAICYLAAAYAFAANGKPDSALHYIEPAIAWYKKIGRPATLALTYLNKADYNLQLRRIKQSLIDCDTALAYAEKANRDGSKGQIYKTIASIYLLQNDYIKSKTYFEKAYGLLSKVKDSITMTSILNNLGTVYRKTNELDKSISSFEKAIGIAESMKYETNFSTYYSNLSEAYFAKGDKNNAEVSAVKAVAFARKQQNDLQLATAQNVLGNLFLASDRLQEATKVLTESYTVAIENHASEIQQIAATGLGMTYSALGNYKLAYTYMDESKKLNDSLIKNRYHQELAAMQTYFSVTEKDKEIRLLNKDKELQQQKLKQQSILVIGAGAIVLLSLIGIWLFIKSNRLSNRMKELELRHQIAADLHDEVGSSLSSIHLLSQMATTGGSLANYNDIISRMSSNTKETMDKMGDIVWMIKPADTEAGSLKKRMERFGYEICSSKNIEATLMINDIDKLQLTMDQRKNIYLIFKEAINNAVKYSGTRKIQVTATTQQKELLLQIKDFGKGFQTSGIKKGNGLDNMCNRARALGAGLEIDSHKNEGTTINLTMAI